MRSLPPKEFHLPDMLAEIVVASEGNELMAWVERKGVVEIVGGIGAGRKKGNGWRVGAVREGLIPVLE